MIPTDPFATGQSAQEGDGSNIRDGSRTAVAGRPMARLVYPQLRKCPCVPAVTLRATSGLMHRSLDSLRIYSLHRRVCALTFVFAVRDIRSEISSATGQPLAHIVSYKSQAGYRLLAPSNLIPFSRAALQAPFIVWSHMISGGRYSIRKTCASPTASSRNTSSWPPAKL
jgi:hypothetical protein